MIPFCGRCNEVVIRSPLTTIVGWSHQGGADHEPEELYWLEHEPPLPSSSIEVPWDDTVLTG